MLHDTALYKFMIDNDINMWILEERIWRSDKVLTSSLTWTAANYTYSILQDEVFFPRNYSLIRLVGVEPTSLHPSRVTTAASLHYNYFARYIQWLIGNTNLYNIEEHKLILD